MPAISQLANLRIAEPTELLNRITEDLEQIILGKTQVIRLALACVLARGHLLIEDVPGVGKTTLAHALAKVLGLTFQRVQFTSDLLPADILGVSVYDRDSGKFSFHPGPIFSQIVLTDEVNRATPRTQSALLEAMEEFQVTVEGETYALPKPFFVVATQNPSYQIGTFSLPEAQLDRFLMRVSLGYPHSEAERALLTGQDRREMLATIPPTINADQLLALQNEAAKVHAADPIIQYLQDILDYTRRSASYAEGLSPRAGLALLRSARAWALLDGRHQVIPEDIQAVIPSVVVHRLRMVEQSEFSSPEALVALLIKEVPIP